MNSLETLNQYFEMDIEKSTMFLPALISVAFGTPWPILLFAYYFVMCPVFMFIYFYLPESMTNIPKQTFWDGILYAPLNWFISIHIYTIERNLDWLIWIGYYSYT